MFHKERYDLCGDCLVKCQWINVEKEQAVEWMTEMIAGNHTPVVDQCITCYACNEICPTHANPFDLFAGLQEKYQRVAQDIIDMTESKLTFTGELFKLCGATRVERTFDRKNAKCCAAVKLLLNAGDPGPDVIENVADAKAAGAEAIVCLCPMCIRSLENPAKEKNLPLIFLGDIARMALGEIPLPALP